MNGKQEDKSDRIINFFNVKGQLQSMLSELVGERNIPSDIEDELFATLHRIIRKEEALSSTPFISFQDYKLNTEPLQNKFAASWDKVLAAYDENPEDFRQLKWQNFLDRKYSYE